MPFASVTNIHLAHDVISRPQIRRNMAPQKFIIKFFKPYYHAWSLLNHTVMYHLHSKPNILLSLQLVTVEHGLDFRVARNKHYNLSMKSSLRNC